MRAIAMMTVVVGLAWSGPAVADDSLEAEMQRSVASWDKSCRGKPHASGLCVDVRPKTDATHCGGSYTRYALRRTKQQVVGERRMRAALDRYRKASEERQRELAGSAADIELRLGDRAAERLLANGFPRNLRFDGDKPALRKRSTETFMKWVKAMQADLKEAGDRYKSARAVHGDDARDRAVFVFEAAAGQLSHGHMPADVRQGPYQSEKMDAYCDELGRAAEPLEQQAARWKPAKP